MKSWLIAIAALLMLVCASTADAQTKPFAIGNRLLCTLPWGGSLSSGGSTTAYSSTTPAANCSTVSETRTCTGSTLSGSFTNQSCTNGCVAQTANWSSCSGSVSALSHGANTTVTNTNGGYTGSVTVTCNMGTLGQSGASCNSSGGSFSKTIFVTSGTSWAVPADWNSGDNKVHAIGAGGHNGGGGGAYASATNVTLTASSSVIIGIGVAGGGGANSTNDTFMCNTGSAVQCTNINSGSYVAVGAKGGASNGGAGGSASSSVGSVKYSGGSTWGGGGGAAGPNGNGGSSSNPGWGGGGANGGQSVSGSNGGNNRLGSGAGIYRASNGGHGTNGGGGAYNGSSYNGGNGSMDALWTQTSNGATAGPGSGGGGGGESNCDPAGNGGNGGGYGGGGGNYGSDYGACGNDGAPGLGTQGILVIQYNPLPTCKALMQTCTTNGECCSNMCTGGSCR